MKEQLENQIIESINSWTDTDIYAISLYVEDDFDNPCKPTVTLGYNTEEQVQAETDSASDENEARWNYAFWLQNAFFIFGIDETAKTVKNWVLSNGFLYMNDEDALNAGEELSAITEAFVSVLIEIVRDIHRQGILTRKFGKELPILIHELEYYDTIAEQNIEANGQELVKDFADWCTCV